MIRPVVDKLLETLLWIILAVMAVVVAANVTCRFAIDLKIFPPEFGLYWADEVAQILLVWLTFLGAAVAVRENDHYYLNYASRKARGGTLRFLVLLRDVLTIVTICALFYYSIRVVLDVRDWIMPATEISRALVYGATPVGCIFMLYYALGLFARHLLEPESIARMHHLPEPVGFPEPDDFPEPVDEDNSGRRGKAGGDV